MAVTLENWEPCSVNIEITAGGRRTLTGATESFLGRTTVSRKKTYAFGNSGANTANQAASIIFTATANTTTRLDLSGGLLNIVADTAGTLTKVKTILIELLTTAQDSVNGNAGPSSVTISPSANEPVITSPLGAAQTYTMVAGEKWLIDRSDTGGITITAGAADGIDFLNNDASVDGKFRITVIGFA